MEPLKQVTIFHRNGLFRECLVRVLRETPGIAVDDTDLDDLQASGNEPQCDLAVIDVNLPRLLALRLTKHFCERSESKVLILVSGEPSDNLLECIAAGAHGCVLEDSSVHHLREAIHDVLHGKTFCSSEIAHSMFSQFSQLAREAQWREDLKSVELTPRERDVIELIAQRCSNKQIAKRLSVSLYTVKNHVHNILDKLQVDSRVAAVDYARQRHWL